MNGREADRLTETALSECGSVLLHCCCGPWRYVCDGAGAEIGKADAVLL